MRTSLKKLSIVLIIATVGSLLSSCGFSDSANIKEPEITEVTEEETETEVTFTEAEAVTEETSSQDLETEAETVTEFEAKTISPEEMGESEKNDMLISDWSLEQKVCQMFALMPDALAGGSTATDISDISYSLEKYPVGGLLFMGNNLKDAAQTASFIAGAQEISYRSTGYPVFTFVDEEGGSVRRISGKFSGIPYAKSMGELAAAGDDVFVAGAMVGAYLSDLGFNADFAPVADVLSNPNNTVIGDRAFGSDPIAVAEESVLFADGLSSCGVLPVYKHFPGHGGTAGDTHEGYAYTEKSVEDLGKCELVPFAAAIADGAECIMAAHISCPGVTGSNIPASLSADVVNGLLRRQMGFDGIVITDAMNMGAIAQNYSSGEAAVMAIEAGVDMVLAPVDFYEAYDALLVAVRSGRISVERIDESVARIINVKEQMR